MMDAGANLEYGHKGMEKVKLDFSTKKQNSDKLRC